MTTHDSPVVLGVDGGGTKTVAVLSDLSGRVLGCGRAGSCDIYSHPQAEDEVELAVRRACATAGLDVSAIGTAVYSLAGADWPEDFSHWRDVLENRRLGADIRIINDAIGVLNSDLPEGDAVVVVCGTGAGIGSRNSAGDTWHSSFWQLTQGGIELTKKALHAVYRADLGIEPPTTLTRPVLDHYRVGSVEDLLHKFEGRASARPTDRAGLVPILFQEADRHDAAALRILQGHGEALAEFAVAAARKVGIVEGPFHLLLTGGVFRNPSAVLRHSLLARMQERGARFSVVDGRSEPVKGAVMAALRTQIGPISPAVSGTLARTLPPASFFHTGLPNREVEILEGQAIGDGPSNSTALVFRREQAGS